MQKSPRMHDTNLGLEFAGAGPRLSWELRPLPAGAAPAFGATGGCCCSVAAAIGGCWDMASRLSASLMFSSNSGARSGCGDVCN